MKSKPSCPDAACREAIRATLRGMQSKPGGCPGHTLFWKPMMQRPMLPEDGGASKVLAVVFACCCAQRPPHASEHHVTGPARRSQAGTLFFSVCTDSMHPFIHLFITRWLSLRVISVVTSRSRLGRKRGPFTLLRIMNNNTSGRSLAS